MAIRYWEFEDAPLKEKLKNPNVREVAKIYFSNDVRAYRFGLALNEVKKKNTLRLKDCSDALPIATWKRYLDYGVQVGLLTHENNAYSFTDRYSKPFKNIATYIKAWVESPETDDMDILFGDVKAGKQAKRGGRVKREQELTNVEEAVQKAADSNTSNSSGQV